MGALKFLIVLSSLIAISSSYPFKTWIQALRTSVSDIELISPHIRLIDIVKSASGDEFSKEVVRISARNEEAGMTDLNGSIDIITQAVEQSLVASYLQSEFELNSYLFQDEFLLTNFGAPFERMVLLGRDFENAYKIALKQNCSEVKMMKSTVQTFLECKVTDITNLKREIFELLKSKNSLDLQSSISSKIKKFATDLKVLETGLKVAIKMLREMAVTNVDQYFSREMAIFEPEIVTQELDDEFFGKLLGLAVSEKITSEVVDGDVHSSIKIIAGLLGDQGGLLAAIGTSITLCTMGLALPTCGFFIAACGVGTVAFGWRTYQELSKVFNGLNS